MGLCRAPSSLTLGTGKGRAGRVFLDGSNQGFKGSDRELGANVGTYFGCGRGPKLGVWAFGFGKLLLG